jgi:malonyl-CoA/methylmalonyl-CoA synthetase
LLQALTDLSAEPTAHHLALSTGFLQATPERPRLEATFAAVVASSRRRAHGLLRLLGRETLAGERVALLVSPGLDWVDSLFAIVLAGGTAVPLSSLHPPAELAYFVDDADVAAVILGDDLDDRRVTFLEVGRRVITPTELDAASGSSRNRHENEAAGAGPLPPRHAADGALMLYTSGTTGRPKGAVLTDENLATQARLLGAAWGLSKDDVLLHTLPLHHMHGVAIAFLSTFFAGARTHFLPRFEATLVWNALEHATLFMGVPTMYHRLLEVFERASEDEQARYRAHASALRLSTSGSAALPVSLAEGWAKLHGRIPLERFGMTEIGVGASNPLGEGRLAGTVGHPLDTVELRIVDEHFVDVPDGTPGEILIAGPSVFAGYFRRTEATQASFHGRYFRTGDTAQREPSGAIRILGRTSVDILKSGGYKISALEIEEILREHPLVTDAAVVGVPDPRWGDRVVAVVVPRLEPGTPRAAAPTADDLRAFCKERLAPYKVPRDFLVQGHLPRNALGKVTKTVLRDAVIEAEAARQPPS